MACGWIFQSSSDTSIDASRRPAPTPGTRGQTEYFDACAAYDGLSEETKDKIKDLIGCHSLFHNRKTANPESPLFMDINPLDHPMANTRLSNVMT